MVRGDSCVISFHQRNIRQLVQNFFYLKLFLAIINCMHNMKTFSQCFQRHFSQSQTRKRIIYQHLIFFIINLSLYKKKKKCIFFHSFFNFIFKLFYHLINYISLKSFDLLFCNFFSKFSSIYKHVANNFLSYFIFSFFSQRVNFFVLTGCPMIFFWVMVVVAFLSVRVLMNTILIFSSA